MFQSDEKVGWEAIMTGVSRRPLVSRAGIRSIGLGILVAAGFPAVPAANASFVTFESGQVRPLALSPDGDRLFAVNTPDNRLEIFAVAPSGLTHVESVPVGLEPVAVAARNAGEVWVVNHLSDSITIVDANSSPPRVIRTLLVGDEPRDIVFAGPGATGPSSPRPIGDRTDRAILSSPRRGSDARTSGSSMRTLSAPPSAARR